MHFPLADWIDQHSDVTHNLGVSGMIGTLRSTRIALRRVTPAQPIQLERALAKLLRVSRERIFLTHGATESNSLVLTHLAARESRRRGSRPLRAFVRHPEYPVLSDAARLLGFRVVSRAPADAYLLSRPNNPTGTSASESECLAGLHGSRQLLVDETFREFTTTPSLARFDEPRVWVVGTFTKAYGADRIRVGYVVAPSESRDSFERAQAAVADGISDASIASAVALLRHRDAILGEARGIFRANQKVLTERLGEPLDLSAPLWFDRGTHGLDGDRLARAALRRSVLVCPGSYFGDPRGVRVTLTRRSFPLDLEAYWRARSASRH